ncbi:hypothetical protein [Dyella silvatica]|uniref:hypothetical protein n=1 Tax=Dyella silvatica TaxID=2992128 RepID=UPI002258E967|nr:hypothetical protein [Dyella silvatica]
MTKHSNSARAVILSGGAEIVSVSIAQAFESAGVSYAVISLVKHSLLARAAGCVSMTDLSDVAGNPERLRCRLLNILTDLHALVGSRLVVFATEDGGLRCLNEFSAEILKIAEFPRARSLRHGGLDKAELFTFLSGTSAAIYMPPTEIVLDVDAAPGVLERLGNDAIFKPALKPWNMDLHDMDGSKVVTQARSDEPIADLLRRLRKAWPLSQRWVAQARLQQYEMGERGVWAVRDGGTMASIEFVERWKYPVQGGTGCWVETLEGNSFVPAAVSILDAVDYVGLAEIPFLKTASGDARLLEINARAWLQVGLAERSGLSPVIKTLHLLSEGPAPAATYKLRPTVWINIERAVAAAAGGGVGPRIAAFAALMRAMAKYPELAIYSSRVRGVRWRWIGRVLTAIWNRLRGLHV